MQKITWQIAKEERVTPWSIIGILSAISLGISIYFFNSQNYFATTFFILSPVVFTVLAKQGPKDMQYELSEKYLKVNNSRHEYKKFKYYSFLDDFLVLKPKEDLPGIYIPVPVDRRVEVEEFIQKNLDEAEHEETLGEIVNRIFNIY